MFAALYKAAVLAVGIAAVILLGIAMNSLRPHRSQSLIHVTAETRVHIR